MAFEAWRTFEEVHPEEKFWRRYVMPRRGEYGGRCNNALCTETGADWFNKASGQYYCDDCARRINESCLKQGRQKLCEVQFYADAPKPR